MKKVFFLVSIFALTVLNAQGERTKLAIKKGAWYLGGNVSINHRDGDNNYKNYYDETVNREWTNKNYTLLPMIGYALHKNLIVGLGVSYGNSSRASTSKTDFNEEEINKYTREAIGVIPFVRAYKGLGDRLGLYLQGEVNYSKYWSENEVTNQVDNSNSGNALFVGLRPGIAFFIAKKFALEASLGALGYNKDKSDGDNSNSESDSFNFSLNSSNLLFGLAYYF